MSPDEIAIRDVIATWMSASLAGDTADVLPLMTDDVVFMVLGQPPFGKQAFATASQSMTGVTMEGTSEIMEVEISGDIAFARSHLAVTVTPPTATPVKRAGYALSVFRKETDGRWRLARDANLMSIVTSTNASC